MLTRIAADIQTKGWRVVAVEWRVTAATLLHKKIKKLFTVRSLLLGLRSAAFSGIKTAFGTLVILAVLWLPFSDNIKDIARGLSPASLSDVKKVSDAMDAYEDFLNQKNQHAQNYLTKEQELFADVLQTVFPAKWNSNLITLTGQQVDALNHGAKVMIEIQFPAFKSVPHFNTFLKNLAYAKQADRENWIKPQWRCEITRCMVELIPVSGRGHRVPLTAAPQLHWIAAGEFPDRADSQPDTVDLGVVPADD